MPSNYWVPMVGHAFRVLECFYDVDSPLSLQEVQRIAQTSSTSAFRILFTLEQMGYVHKDEATGKYELTFKIIHAARKSLSGRGLISIVHPHLVNLRDRFNETVNLAVLQGREIVYVEILESNQSFRMAAAVGSRVPLHSTALGKAIAAFLPPKTLHSLLRGVQFKRVTRYSITSRKALMKVTERVRREGYSRDQQETEMGASCLAVPILDSDNLPLAAISVSGPTPRIHARQSEMIRALKEAAFQVSSSMNSSGSHGSVTLRKLTDSPSRVTS